MSQNIARHRTTEPTPNHYNDPIMVYIRLILNLLSKKPLGALPHQRKSIASLRASSLVQSRYAPLAATSGEPMDFCTPHASPAGRSGYVIFKISNQEDQNGKNMTNANNKTRVMQIAQQELIEMILTKSEEKNGLSYQDFRKLCKAMKNFEKQLHELPHPSELGWGFRGSLAPF